LSDLVDVVDPVGMLATDIQIKPLTQLNAMCTILSNTRKILNGKQQSWVGNNAGKSVVAFASPLLSVYFTYKVIPVARALLCTEQDVTKNYFICYSLLF
jgi:hypothetical protein